MKKFHFKLEAVLSERKRVEDLKLREWMSARRKVIGLIDELRSMETRLELAFEEATKLHENANVAMTTAMESFIQGTKLRMHWKRGEIDRAMKAADKRRLDYVLASQKRSALSKLRERKFEQYRDEVRGMELKNLDDLYIMRAQLNADPESLERDEEAAG